MLVIRPEQIEVFNDHMVGQFEEQMLAHLRSYFPEQAAGMSKEDLRALVREAVETAERYGVVRVDDVETYLDCMMILGRHFHIHPQTRWAGDILRREDLNGSDKMRQIAEQLPPDADGNA